MMPRWYLLFTSAQRVTGATLLPSREEQHKEHAEAMAMIKREAPWVAKAVPASDCSLEEIQAAYHFAQLDAIQVQMQMLVQGPSRIARPGAAPLIRPS